MGGCHIAAHIPAILLVVPMAMSHLPRRNHK
jgi:hypothetical protein